MLKVLFCHSAAKITVSVLAGVDFDWEYPGARKKANLDLLPLRLPFDILFHLFLRRTLTYTPIPNPVYASSTDTQLIAFLLSLYIHKAAPEKDKRHRRYHLVSFLDDIC